MNADRRMIIIMAISRQFWWLCNGGGGSLTHDNILNALMEGKYYSVGGVDGPRIDQIIIDGRNVTVSCSPGRTCEYNMRWLCRSRNYDNGSKGRKDCRGEHEIDWHRDIHPCGMCG